MVLKTGSPLLSITLKIACKNTAHHSWVCTREGTSWIFGNIAIISFSGQECIKTIFSLRKHLHRWKVKSLFPITIVFKALVGKDVQIQFGVKDIIAYGNFLNSSGSN